MPKFKQKGMEASVRYATPSQGERMLSDRRGVLPRAEREADTVLPGRGFTEAQPKELEEVLSFRRSIYLFALGNEGVDDYDRVALHLIARDSDGKLVAAFRAVPPEARPFDLERYVPAGLPQLSGRVAEVGRFCVREDYRSIRKRHFVHVGALKRMILLAKREGWCGFLMLSLPHLDNLYRTAFFKPLDVSFDHPVWGPVSLMYLHVETFKDECRNTRPALFRFLFETDTPKIIA